MAGKRISTTVHRTITKYGVTPKPLCGKTKGKTTRKFGVTNCGHCKKIESRMEAIKVNFESSNISQKEWPYLLINDTAARNARYMDRGPMNREELIEQKIWLQEQSWNGDKE